MTTTNQGCLCLVGGGNLSKFLLSFSVQFCHKTALPDNETVMGVNFNMFLTFWAEIRQLRWLCLCVADIEKLCTYYHPPDSVIACRPCVIIILRGTIPRTTPNICDFTSVLPVHCTLCWACHYLSKLGFDLMTLVNGAPLKKTNPICPWTKIVAML